jgi:predicted DNA-binding protein with PD1-like motif
MKYARLSDNTSALRLDPGDDIHDTLQQFCVEQGIDNAHIHGIGSIESPTLAHYSMKTKQFTDQGLDGIFEVTALLGNIALVDGQPFAHLHVTVADEHMMVRAGHLVKGACSATLELFLTSYPAHHTKSQNDQIGLKVWDFTD